MKPIVALDIDGTLGDYHSNFLEFARRYFDVDDWAWRLGDNPGLPLWEWMKISQRDYRDAKLAYRQGGWKRWMPVYPGASELTREIRSAGAEVWICTTRPYLRLDNVDPDTREWLRRNEIEYDAVIFDPLDEARNKYDELWDQATTRVAAIVDDLPEMVVAAREAGQFGSAWNQPILRDQPYNRHFPWLLRAKGIDDMRHLCLDGIRDWKERWNA